MKKIKKSPIIISLYNVKGGCGKTITSNNIAATLSLRGYKVLLIDTDSQGNSSSIFLTPSGKNEIKYDISDVLLNVNDTSIEIEDAIYPVWQNELSTLSILPFSKRQYGDYEDDSTISINDFINRENTLNRKLYKIKNNYDFIIIDCPPALKAFTKNALVASTHVIVPFKVDYFAFEGVSHLIDDITIVKENNNESLDFMGILLTMDNSTRVNKDVREELSKRYNTLFLDTTIRHGVAVVDSTFQFLPVVLHDKNAAVSQDYFALCDLMLKMLT